MNFCVDFLVDFFVDFFLDDRNVGGFRAWIFLWILFCGGALAVDFFVDFFFTVACDPRCDPSWISLVDFFLSQNNIKKNPPTKSTGPQKIEIHKALKDKIHQRLAEVSQAEGNK